MTPRAAGILLPERFGAFQNRNADFHTQKGGCPGRCMDRASCAKAMPCQRMPPCARQRLRPPRFAGAAHGRSLPAAVAPASQGRARRLHRQKPGKQLLSGLLSVSKSILTRSQTKTGFRLNRLALRCAHKFCAQRKTYTLRSVSRIFADVHAAGKNDHNRFCACGRKTLRGFRDRRFLRFFVIRRNVGAGLAPPGGTTSQIWAHRRKHARTRRGGRPCPPGGTHP